MTLQGIDVSHHQATTPSLAGRDFLIARATYGTSFDGMYISHVRAARRAGLVTGAYHFGRHGDFVGQARAFLESANRARPDLYALDLESDGGHEPMSFAEARAFIEIIQSTGRPCGLYHSASGYPDLGQDWRWVADWRPVDEPPVRWDIWQYRGAPLDLDRFEGSRDELVSLGRQEEPMQSFALKGPRTGSYVLNVDTALIQMNGSRIGVKAGREGGTFGLVELEDGRPAYLVGCGSTTCLLVADSRATFTPAPAADCDDAVRVERDRVKGAAIDAIGAIE